MLSSAKSVSQAKHPVPSKLTPSIRARRVSLSPKPGFVVKTRSEKAGNYVPTSSPNTALSIPLGFKVFLNICYDDAVPQPPAASDAEIRRAMEGEDLDREGTYFVPLVVGDGREVKDRGMFLDVQLWLNGNELNGLFVNSGKSISRV